MVVKMEKLSQREAAKRAGVALRSVQAALESGRLDSLDERDVQIWAYSRADVAKVAASIRKVRELWEQRARWMPAQCIKDLDRGVEPGNNTFRATIDGFIANLLTLSESEKYVFSEAVDFVDEDFVAMFEGEAPEKLHKNLQARFLYSIYRLVSTDTASIIREIRAKDPRLEIDIEDLKIDLFKNFYAEYVLRR